MFCHVYYCLFIFVVQSDTNAGPWKARQQKQAKEHQAANKELQVQRGELIPVNLFPIFLGFGSPHVAKPEVTCEWVHISIIMESCTIYSLPGRKIFNFFFFHVSGILRHSQVLRFWHSEILCQCQRSIHQGPSQASRCHGHGMAEVWNMEGSCPSRKESNFPTKYIKYIKYICYQICYILLYKSIRVNNHVWTQHTRLLAADMLTAMSWATDWEGDFLPRKKAVASAPRSDRVRGWPSDGCAKWIAEICANWYWNDLKCIERVLMYFEHCYRCCMLLFTTLSTNAGCGILQQRSWSRSGAVVEAFRPIFNSLRSPKPQWMVEKS